MLFRQLVGDAVLAGIGVLILIDKDIAIAAAQFVCQVGIFFKKEGDPHEQIIKIQGSVAVQLLLIGLVIIF